MGLPHVCYATLAAAPWLVIAGALVALCGLLACNDAARVISGAAASATAAGAGILAFRLLWAEVADPPRRPVQAGAGPRRER